MKNHPLQLLVISPEKVYNTALLKSSPKGKFKAADKEKASAEAKGCFFFSLVLVVPITEALNEVLDHSLELFDEVNESLYKLIHYKMPSFLNILVFATLIISYEVQTYKSFL